MKCPHIGRELFFILTLIHLCLCSIYEYSDLPSTQFDFVIVGGGAGGNVIANRLTENPNFSVLLLEAGISNEGVIETTVPFLNIFLRSGTPYDWNYTTISQAGLDRRVIDYPRGRILGGCTSTNGMAYTRGSAEDFDRYAKVTGDIGWSWNSLQSYIRKNEKWTEPADHHNTTGQFDPAIHGFHGITSVSLPGFSQAIDDRVLQTTVELPNEFPYNEDVNSGYELGVSWRPSTIGGGQRSSSATSYLGPEFMKRSNLHVLLNAQVLQLLQTSSGPANTFKHVEFVERTGGKQKQVVASRESIGIQTRIHLPDVGKNLSAQSAVTISYFVNSTDTYDDIVRNQTLRSELLQIWNQTRAGPLVDGIANNYIYTRLSNHSMILANQADPAAGPHTPHFQIGIYLIHRNGLSPNPPPTGNFISFAPTIVTPTPRGSVRLNTSDPLDQPLIDIRSLSTDFDIFALQEGIKIVQHYILVPNGNFANVRTDVELEQYLRANAAPNGHIVGSSSMSPRDASYGVVDPDLLVKGTSGLRVVDASVLPFVPSANSMAAVYIIAESS
ncbi:GMC oxidoreductase [Ramaria rubella]|nr:GMC oxidoreductase [Ramaria rubella]